jgi:hypothetical protein
MGDFIAWEILRESMLHFKSSRHDSRNLMTHHLLSHRRPRLAHRLKISGEACTVFMLDFADGDVSRPPDMGMNYNESNGNLLMRIGLIIAKRGLESPTTRSTATPRRTSRSLHHAISMEPNYRSFAVRNSKYRDAPSNPDTWSNPFGDGIHKVVSVRKA